MSKNILLAFLGGILLWLGWPPLHFPYLLFVGLVPLLLIENHFIQNKQKFGAAKLFGIAFLHFFVWNILTTSWVCEASLVGGIAANLVNCLLMSVPVLLYHKVRLRFTQCWAMSSIVFFWLGFEYFHLRWDLSWPWLTLGNGFASEPWMVQWYEYTGHLGGSVWIWVVNILVFQVICSSIKKGKIWRQVFGALFTAIIPVLFSVFILIFINQWWFGGGPTVMVVQPNIDPYNEKFEGLSAAEQLKRMLSHAESKMDGSEKLLILPETALTDNTEESEIDNANGVKTIRQFIDSHPQLALITGANTYKLYREGQQHPPTAHRIGDGEVFVENFNTALLIAKDKPVQYYYKSKLVPGAEKMPYPKFFSFLESFAIDLGGTSGSLGMQDESEVFDCGEGIVAAPIICYESNYGEYVSSYVKKGANLLCIITNEGWWGNTDGYKQHLMYASLRAIETRRYIARSANTGISCFITPCGEIVEATNWWEPAVIKMKVDINRKKTLYTQIGDLTGLIGLLGSLVFVIFLSFTKFIFPQKG